MKSITSLIILVSLLSPAALAQTKKKKPVQRRPPATAKKVPVRTEQPRPRIIGSEVVVTTKNGDQIKGVVLDLTAYSIRLRVDKLESILALDTITAITFGSSPAATEAVKPTPATGPDFARDADQVLRAMLVMGSGAKAGADYTDYGHQLTEFRRQAERFIQKYSISENPTETRMVSLVSGVLTDYTWARTIWTLKLGRSADGMVGEADSPVIIDALSLYPDLRATNGNRLSAEMLIGGLWKKAAEKIEAARGLIK
jgi:hypothetical protein